jgi:hypothetical protein
MHLKQDRSRFSPKWTQPVEPLDPSDGDIWFDTSQNILKLCVKGNSFSSLKFKSIDFAETQTGVPTEFTFSRNSVATRFNRFGYIETVPNNILRHEWDSLSGEYLGVNIENTRYNLIKQSENFSAAQWVYSQLFLNPTTYVTTPNGSSSLCKICEDGLNIKHSISQIVNFNNTTVTPVGRMCCFSLYVKVAERNQIIVTLPASVFGVENKILFTIPLLQYSVLSGNVTKCKIKRITKSGWYRLNVVTPPIVTATAGTVMLSLAKNNSETYLGDGASGLYIWGAQFENYLNLSSYIPTTTAAGVRAADVLTSNTALFDFSSVEGTVLIEANMNDYVEYAGTRPIFSLNNQSSPNDNYISSEISHQSPNAISMKVVSNSVEQTNLNIAASTTDSQFYKIGISYQTDNISGCVSGGLVYTDSSVQIPTGMNQIVVGRGSSTWLFGHIKEFAYIPIKISNDRLKELTEIGFSSKLITNYYWRWSGSEVTNLISNFCYIYGGTLTSTVERISFPFYDGNSISTAVIDQMREAPAGCNSSQYGFVLGFSTTSLIQRFLFPADTVAATTVGSLSYTKNAAVEACNSSQHGYVAGGSSISTVARIQFPFDGGFSQNRGILNAARSNNASFNSSNYGFFAGGLQGATRYSNIYRLEFPFDSGTTSQIGLLFRNESNCSGCNSSQYGYVVGGDLNSTTQYSSIDRIIFSLDSGNMSGGGALTVNNILQKSNNSIHHGYVHGGTNQVSKIERFQFPFESGIAKIAGTLRCQKNNHGGIDNTDFSALFA